MNQPCAVLVYLLYSNVKKTGFCVGRLKGGLNIVFAGVISIQCFRRRPRLSYINKNTRYFYYSNCVTRRKWRHQLNLHPKNPPSRKHPDFTPPSWIWPWKPSLPAQTLRAHPYPPYETTSQRNTKPWTPRQLNFDWSRRWLRRSRKTWSLSPSSRTTDP